MALLQELKRLLDDDEDMADMYLARALQLPASRLNSRDSPGFSTTSPSLSTPNSGVSPLLLRLVMHVLTSVCTSTCLHQSCSIALMLLLLLPPPPPLLLLLLIGIGCSRNRMACP